MITGSFHPIDNDDWSASAYRNLLDDFFDAIVGGEENLVLQLIAEGNVDVNMKSSDGWTPLQLAIKHNLNHVVPELIGAGARWPTPVPTLEGVNTEPPPYQQHSPMHFGTWPLSDQVNKLALLLQHVLA